MSDEFLTKPVDGNVEGQKDSEEEPLTLTKDNIRLRAQVQREREERLRAEEALRASENNYRLITDTIPQIIWGANEKGWVDFIHERIEGFAGIPADEIVRAGWLSIVHSDDRAHAAERWIRSLIDGTFYEAEFRVQRADGSYCWHVASAQPVRGKDGIILRWFGTLTDIDERRRLQEQVEAERMIAVKNQRHFLREMLFGMTEGRLRVCDDAQELPTELPSAMAPVALSAPNLKVLREQIEAEALSLGFATARIQDLVTAASEAAMNAVRHARGGIGRVHTAPDEGTIQIWVRDKGEGIAEHLIHRAVESGWTTGGFGQGFHLMWKTCDRLYLLTEPQGTTVVLEMNRTSPKPAWFRSPE